MAQAINLARRLQLVQAVHDLRLPQRRRLRDRAAKRLRAAQHRQQGGQTAQRLTVNHNVLRRGLNAVHCLQVRECNVHQVVGNRVVAVQLLPAVLTTARVQEEHVHRRNTARLVGTVEGVLHALAEPHLTVELDEQRRIRGGVTHTTEHVLVTVRGLHPLGGGQRVNLFLSQDELLHRRVLKLHHTHATTDTVAHGLGVQRVALAGVQGGAQAHLVVIAQPGGALAGQRRQEVVGGTPGGFHLHAQLPPASALDAGHKGTVKVLLIGQAVDEHEHLLRLLVVVQEGNDAFVLTDAAVFAVHRLDDGGAFGDDLKDAGVQLFGADRIGDNGADEGAVHARCRYGARDLGRGRAHGRRNGTRLRRSSLFRSVLRRSILGRNTLRGNGRGGFVLAQRFLLGLWKHSIGENR